jgi:hypothetical protein
MSDPVRQLAHRLGGHIHTRLRLRARVPLWNG